MSNGVLTNTSEQVSSGPFGIIERKEGAQGARGPRSTYIITVDRSVPHSLISADDKPTRGP